MSQERTEQRDPVRDREYMKTVKMLPTWTKTYETMKEQAVIAWPYWMELAEQRREERDSNQRLHMQALEEIHSLNLTITGQNEALEQQAAKVRERDAKIKQLSNLGREYVEAFYIRGVEITEADAWAEYWRREALRNHPTQEAYDAACAALEKHKERADVGDKEIERLRMEMQCSADDLREFFEIPYKDIPFEAKKIADHLASALKGAE